MVATLSNPIFSDYSPPPISCTPDTVAPKIPLQITTASQTHDIIKVDASIETVNTKNQEVL